jgi:mono/diheme cytochrome c family protein
MKKPLKVTLTVVALVLLVVGVGLGIAVVRANGIISQTVETHRVDFAIPFPLTEEEMAALDPSEDPETVATERAMERGRHLVHARYGCADCHGEGFGGGVMIDDPMVGTALGPNITTGEGSRTLDYTASDWDRAVRHGVLPDGRPSVMPAVDYQLMSDQELSDVIVYLRAQPPIDDEVEPPSLGPLGAVLVATGALPFAALEMASHQGPHATLPPATEVSIEFGRHLAAVCTGCHGADFSGGPIMGGDPSWGPARNLTPHEEGLAGWTYEDFQTALRDMTRPDGTALLEPMTLVAPLAANMTDVEVRALWTYLRSVPPRPTGG